MPGFRPFHAVRFAPGIDLHTVIAPPYDVLSDSDVDALAATSPHNIVTIDVPRGEADRYDRAAATFTEWLETGILLQDADPTFTIYRMSFTDATGSSRSIVGVLGGLAVVDPDGGGVLPHERTTAKAVTDRLDLTRSTAANLSPVWGLSLAQGLTAALTEPGEPVGTITVDGVTHSVERVADPARIARISEILASDDVLIADGHHRYAISRTYRDQVRTATGSSATEAEFTLTFVNELKADQLSIEAIHRLYHDIPTAELRTALSRSFEITSAPAPTPDTLTEMVEKGRLVLLEPDGSAFWMTPRPEVFEGVRALDGAYLEHALVDVAATVSYQHGLGEMVERVGDGTVSAGVLIRPTSLAEIQRTAREGLLMPPKSTFFTPKLRTGFVIRPTAALPV